MYSNVLKCIYLTQENYGVFYHDWGNYGRGKYGGISPKPPIFPVIILPVTSASQFFFKFQDNLLVSFCPR